MASATPSAILKEDGTFFGSALKPFFEAEIPGPVDREATVLLAHARKSSPEFASFRGGLYAHPFFYDGIFLCHNGTVRDIERLGLSHGTDSQRLLFWLSKRWKPRTPERLEDCLRELLGTISDFSALNLLLSDGENLYALCAFRANPEYFTLWFRKGADFVAVASEPADEEGGWIPMENGELLGIHPDLSITRLRVLDSLEVRSVFSREGEKGAKVKREGMRMRANRVSWLWRWGFWFGLWGTTWASLRGTYLLCAPWGLVDVCIGRLLTGWTIPGRRNMGWQQRAAHRHEQLAGDPHFRRPHQRGHFRGVQPRREAPRLRLL
jgi:hypothetical protein